MARRGKSSAQQQLFAGYYMSTFRFQPRQWNHCIEGGYDQQQSTETADGSSPIYNSNGPIALTCIIKEASHLEELISCHSVSIRPIRISEALSVHSLLRFLYLFSPLVFMPLRV